MTTLAAEMAPPADHTKGSRRAPAGPEPSAPESSPS